METDVIQKNEKRKWEIRLREGRGGNKRTKHNLNWTVWWL